jgi:hypothetical protein
MLTRRAKAAAEAVRSHAAASSTKTPSPSPTPTIPGAPKKRKRVVVDSSPEISSIASSIDVVMLIANPTEDPKDTTVKFIRKSRINAQIHEFFFVYRRLTEDNYDGLTPLMVNRALIFSTIDDATAGNDTCEEPIHAAIRAELQAAYPNIWESLPKGKMAHASESKSYKFPCRIPAEWRITKIVSLISEETIFNSNEIKDGGFIFSDEKHAAAGTLDL